MDTLLIAPLQPLLLSGPDHWCSHHSEELDRETKSTRTSSGSRRRTTACPTQCLATLTILVTDTNDHDPVFEQQEYKESLRKTWKSAMRCLPSEPQMVAAHSQCQYSIPAGGRVWGQPL